MTRNEFFVTLQAAHARHPFHLMNYQIRQSETGCCPICAVVQEKTGVKWDNALVIRAAVEIQLEYEVCRDMINASDGNSLNPAYRRIMEIIT